MPFEWQETANHVNDLLVAPFGKCFTTLTTEANLLLANESDYNDIAIRLKPGSDEQASLNSRLPLPAVDSLRKLIVLAYITARSSTGPGIYKSNSALMKQLDNHRHHEPIDCFKEACQLNLDRSINQPRLHDSVARRQLLLANQLMPLADNLSEAAASVAGLADLQSRRLLAEWVKISRVEGLFFLFTFFNLLLCGWVLLRLANEVRQQKARPKAAPPPKPYRELADVRFYLSMTVLLFIPLYRTVDENTVRTDRPFWFLNLPELISNVVQPLPNTASNSNSSPNTDVLNRFDTLDTRVKELNRTAAELRKITQNARDDIQRQQYR